MRYVKVIILHDKLCINDKNGSLHYTFVYFYVIFFMKCSSNPVEENNLCFMKGEKHER